MDFLINAGFFISILALLFYFAGYIFKKQNILRYSAVLLFFSWLFFLGYFLIYAINAKRFPVSNQYESVMLLAQIVLAVNFYFYFSFSRKESFLVPSLILTPLLYALLNLLDPTIKPLMPVLRSNWLFFHVLSAMISYSFFAIAGVAALIHIFTKKTDFQKDYLILSVRVGFAMLTIAIITGAVWAENAWNRYWSWDPKETWSLITWFYYALILHLRKHKLSHRSFLFALFFGLLVVIFTYFGVNYLLSGLHSYA